MRWQRQDQYQHEVDELGEYTGWYRCVGGRLANGYWPEWHNTSGLTRYRLPDETLTTPVRNTSWSVGDRVTWNPNCVPTEQALHLKVEHGEGPFIVDAGLHDTTLDLSSVQSIRINSVARTYFPATWFQRAA